MDYVCVNLHFFCLPGHAHALPKRAAVAVGIVVTVIDPGHAAVTGDVLAHEIGMAATKRSAQSPKFAVSRHSDGGSDCRAVACFLCSGVSMEGFGMVSQDSGFTGGWSVLEVVLQDGGLS